MFIIPNRQESLPIPWRVLSCLLVHAWEPGQCWVPSFIDLHPISFSLTQELIILVTLMGKFPEYTYLHLSELGLLVCTTLASST